MDIYVVQPGDTINTIANMYGITVLKLIQDNELENPYDLVPGQTIVIVYPKQTHTIKEGDTLIEIANTYNVTIMQLFRNNPTLTVKEYIYPGETLIISYNTIRNISTNGFAYPFINVETLRKTLPSLTYLSIFSYKVLEKGEIISFYDDTEIVQIAKAYSAAPLIMVTTLTERGEPNVEIEYTILLNEEYQDRLINNLINIINAKGYYGINLVLNYLNTSNQMFYLNFLTKISSRFMNEGYHIIITINPNIKNINNNIYFERVDYSGFNQLVDRITFLQFIWGNNTNPPSPVSSIHNLRAFMEYVTTMVLPEKIILGNPIISYDWELPFIPGISSTTSLTLNSTISLANDVGSAIQFDETSQTPYFGYSSYSFRLPVQHIVWSIDAKSINALNELVLEYSLTGTGTWNIMIYYAQLWLLINSQFEVEKLLPEI